MKRWPLFVALLCLLAALGCLKPRWPQNQNPEVERRVISFLAKEFDEEENQITRSTYLNTLFEDDDALHDFLDDLAADLAVTVPQNAYHRVRTVGDVIDLMGSLTANKPLPPEQPRGVVPEEKQDR